MIAGGAWMTAFAPGAVVPALGGCQDVRMELGVHLPLVTFGDEEVSSGRVGDAVDAAVEYGFAALAANDHFLFQRPWLDGPTALASVIERSEGLELATTVSLGVLRGPVPLAKMLAAVAILSEGRLTAAIGPGSSQADYELVGVDFEQRWSRLGEVVMATQALLGGNPVPAGLGYYPMPAETVLTPLSPYPVPLWIGSWGSQAGLRRVARLADGWLASAYNTTPPLFRAARTRLAQLLAANGRPAADFPNALATMWTWVGDQPEADHRLTEVLAPMLRRDPETLRSRVCVGTAEHCAEVLSAYADAGCERVYLWPIGDDREQLERVAIEVMPLLEHRSGYASRRATQVPHSGTSSTT
jgi:alkanesulfonate monooxygenase SsuD/methylene tetrahydromethanopterin reductase-like flavin-dependent oxidoreductase (luciferase family)